MDRIYKLSLFVILPIIVSCTSNCTGGSGGSDGDDGTQGNDEQQVALTLEGAVSEFAPGFLNTATKDQIVEAVRNYRSDSSVDYADQTRNVAEGFNSTYEVGSSCGVGEITIGVSAATPTLPMTKLILAEDDASEFEERKPPYSVDVAFAAIAVEGSEHGEGLPDLYYYGLNNETKTLLIAHHNQDVDDLSYDMYLVNLDPASGYTVRASSVVYEDDGRLFLKEEYTESFPAGATEAIETYSLNFTNQTFSEISADRNNTKTLKVEITADPESTGSLSENERSIRITASNSNPKDFLDFNAVDFFGVLSLGVRGECEISRIISKE
ncbi:MAG: hypothetical protein HRU19_08770 [Pseudobacteriovorax sp.]|nr:hypothetical protein [Pseudobacteriovorax sp.]